MYFLSNVNDFEHFWKFWPFILYSQDIHISVVLSFVWLCRDSLVTFRRLTFSKNKMRYKVMLTLNEQIFDQKKLTVKCELNQFFRILIRKTCKFWLNIRASWPSKNLACCSMSWKKDFFLFKSKFQTYKKAAGPYHKIHFFKRPFF